MATDQFSGPVDYLVFAFDEGADLGEGLRALLERVEQGIIEILDIELIDRDGGGAPVKRPFSDLSGTTGLDLSVFDMGLKGKLRELADDTGGEAFFIGDAKQLPEIYRKIESEVRAQYFLTYLTESTRKENEYRLVEVRVGKPGYRAKTIRGYFP